MLSLLSVLRFDPVGDFDGFVLFVKDCFKNFNFFSDLIDILLLSVLFFLAVKFFKNRKVGALLLGIVVCLIIFVFATLFDFSGIRRILASIFEIGVLALIVIFQPEIRDLLEKVGSGSIRGLRSIGDKEHKKKIQYKTIDSVVRAVEELSSEKTGALIVFEMTTKLDDIIESGTRLNAEISDQLLRNIFVNKAPLHDGAVIISDGRIAAASCILPLPKRTIVSGDLGTRHRAAVGLSELSDAITIVVSEETGIISIARETELVRNFTTSSLRKFLVREIIHDSVNDDDSCKTD